MAKFSRASWKCLFLQNCQNIDGVIQNNLQGFYRIHKTPWKKIEIFFSFAIYQTYTFALRHN